MLYPLKQVHTFDKLARALDPLGLGLSDVRACTFPSRPEPARACWKVGDAVVMRYHYEPDWELRGLEVSPAWAAHMTRLPDQLCQQLGLFDSWEVMAQELLCEQRARMLRACAAWGWRAVRAHQRAQRAEAERRLVEALEQTSSVQLGRQVCLQLRRCATPAARPALARAAQHEDLQVRLHAREALSALEERAFLGSRGR